MNVYKRTFHLLSLICGLLGLLGCIAAVFGIWSIDARVNQATEKVYGVIDGSLVRGEERMIKVQDRVQALKITTADIEQSVKKWSITQAHERLAARLELEEKAERLASGLHTTDHWLDVTESSVQVLREVLNAGSAIGVPAQLEPVERLLEKLGALRAQLSQAIEPVEKIRDRTKGSAEDKLSEERVKQIVQLALRVVASLSSIDSRLVDLRERLLEMQSDAQDAKARSLWRIQITAIGITLLILWMAAGQGSLCFLGWKGLRQRQTERPPDHQKAH